MIAEPEKGVGCGIGLVREQEKRDVPAQVERAASVSLQLSGHGGPQRRGPRLPYRGPPA